MYNTVTLVLNYNTKGPSIKDVRKRGGGGIRGKGHVRTWGRVAKQGWTSTSGKNWSTELFGGEKLL